MAKFISPARKGWVGPPNKASPVGAINDPGSCTITASMCRRFALLLMLTLPTLLLAQTSSSKSKPHGKLATSTPRETAETIYRNPDLGFTYKIPYAWIDRTKQMQDDSADPAKSRLLLAVFQRPPEAIGDTVNSAVVITAESVASYPGLKTAADYMGPLTELATGKGFKGDGGPYEFPVGATTLVRGDFIRDTGSLSMRQSSLVVLRKGFVISFTFVAGSEDEIDELIEKLSVTASKP